MEPRPASLDPIDEQRLRFVANTVPVLLAYVDDGARYVWSNETYLRWFGRAPESIRGQHMRDVLGDVAWAEIRPRVERVLAGEEIEFETRLVYAAGPTRDVRAVYVPDRDVDGRIRGFVAHVTDVGEMQTAERALQDSQRMLAQSQAAAHVGSWEATYRDDGAVSSLRWSDENYRIFGYQPGAVAIDRGFFLASIHPDDRAPMLAAVTAEIEQRDRFEQEFRIVRPDGSARLIHSWTTVERDAAGRPSRLLGTCQDITERKLAQSEIRQTREKLQLIMDATPAIIARYDRGGRIVWANRSYAARFGKEPEQVEGKHLREVIGEEAFAAIEPYIGRVLAGETIEMEADFPYPAGVRTMHVRAAPTCDAKGAPDGCVAVLTDNTHRRALERERERALQDLKDADRRKDEFLAMLSHELRNPMAPILTAVEIMRIADPNDTETLANFRGVIERQVVHMKRLLDDLLDVSRVSQGKIELRREVVDVALILHRAAEVSRPLMAEKNQRLSLTSTSAAVLVDADATRLVQVFGNLLNNAAKYSEQGGSIEIDLVLEGAEAVVRVRDHGMGMNLDLLENAFDLFVQDTRSLDRSQGGMGIGLTMVRSLVKMHGGTVRALSDGPGRGCEIVVRLPRAPNDALPARRTPTGNGIVRAARPLRILVVDDNVDAARTLGQLLGLLGHDVALAHDGPSALATSQEVPPELVFIDIGLPGMDGYGLAAALRASGLNRAALIAVTGYGRDEDLRRSSEHGFDHHLVKPVDMAALQRVTAQHQSG